ncbi:hypothetical protein LCGC14_0457170 [marine sediment metagenome]|uniref:Uncharacterized protein n=1 Tax=marine sediment metagenome TaxID=412755 RepID=A0A0F9SZ22_9ZZZZ
MKRKPIHILAGLINAMNSLDKDHEYSINEIHEKTNYHWNTVSDYIKLIILTKEFSPNFEIDEKSNGIIITKESPYFKNFNIFEQFLLYLFKSKAFNEESAINKNKIVLSDRSELNPNEEFKAFIKYTSNNGLYLTLKGKFRAQGILASIYSDMCDYIENKPKIPLKKLSKVWLLNFYENNQSLVEQKMTPKKIRSEPKVELEENRLEDYESLLAIYNKPTPTHKISTESIA